MGKMLNNAVKESIKAINAKNMTTKEMKNYLRDHADNCEGFENMIFEIGLKKVVKSVKKYL